MKIICAILVVISLMTVVQCSVQAETAGPPRDLVTKLDLSWRPSMVGGIRDGYMVTEFGVTWIGFNNSALFNPLCTTVSIPESNPLRSDPNSPHWQRENASCGGDNPRFIGWPIAYEWTYCFGMRKLRCRVGWFHTSAMFDGGNVFGQFGDDHELFFDGIPAFTMTKIWKKDK